MQFTSYLASAVLAALVYLVLPTQRVVVRREVEVQLDPRGSTRTDLEYIRKHTRPVHWTEGDTLETVAYRQGQADLIKFIETKVLGRRLN